MKLCMRSVSRRDLRLKLSSNRPDRDKAPLASPLTTAVESRLTDNHVVHLVASFTAMFLAPRVFFSSVFTSNIIPVSINNLPRSPQHMHLLAY